MSAPLSKEKPIALIGASIPRSGTPFFKAFSPSISGSGGDATALEAAMQRRPR
jgi:hypothetical protein